MADQADDNSTKPISTNVLFNMDKRLKENTTNPGENIQEIAKEFNAKEQPRQQISESPVGELKSEHIDQNTPMDPTVLFVGMDKRIKNARTVEERAEAIKDVTREYNLKNVFIPPLRESVIELEKQRERLNSDIKTLHDKQTSTEKALTALKNNITSLETEIHNGTEGIKHNKEAVTGIGETINSVKRLVSGFPSARMLPKTHDDLDDELSASLIGTAQGILGMQSFDPETGQVNKIGDKNATVWEWYARRLGLKFVPGKNQENLESLATRILDIEFWGLLSSTVGSEVQAKEKQVSHYEESSAQIQKTIDDRKRKLDDAKKERNEIFPKLNEELITSKEALEARKSELSAVEDSLHEKNKQIRGLENELNEISERKLRFGQGESKTEPEKASDLKNDLVGQTVLVDSGSGRLPTAIYLGQDQTFSGMLNIGSSIGQMGLKIAGRAASTVIKDSTRRVANKAVKWLAKKGMKKAAGWLATVATTSAMGAAAGTEVPIIGNIIGFVVGLVVGLGISALGFIKKNLKLILMSVLGGAMIVAAIIAKYIGMIASAAGTALAAAFPQAALAFKSALAVKGGLQALAPAIESAKTFLTNVASQGQIAFSKALTAFKESSFFGTYGSSLSTSVANAVNGIVSTVNLSALATNVSTFFSTMASGAILPSAAIGTLATGTIGLAVGIPVVKTMLFEDVISAALIAPADTVELREAPDVMGTPEYLRVTKTVNPNRANMGEQVEYTIKIVPIAGPMQVTRVIDTIRRYNNGEDCKNGCAVTGFSITGLPTAGQTIDREMTVTYRYTPTVDNSVYVNTIDVTAALVADSSVEQTRSGQAVLTVGNVPNQGQPYQFPIAGRITTLDAERFDFQGTEKTHRGVMNGSGSLLVDGGIDIAPSGGMGVVSTLNGTVEFSGRGTGQAAGVGGLVVITNPLYRVAFVHLNWTDLQVKAGDQVTRGQSLGSVYQCVTPRPTDGLCDSANGVTKSTGTHLHYQVLYNGVNKNFGDSGNAGLCRDVTKIERAEQTRAGSVAQYQGSDCP